ncbi:MAG TPA: hypothetical protein VFU48_05125 [Nitrospira sp.]|nr:hypothetical protein [Nitrospira sp.]
MAMPQFTAEGALSRTNRHYRSATQAIYSLAQMNRQIYPMLDRPEVPPVIDVPGEEIPVHSCPPGESDWGGKCYPILTEPPLGGGGESGGSGEVGGGGGPGGGASQGKPPKHPKPPGRSLPKRPPKDYHPESGKPCHAVQFQDFGDDLVFSEIKVAKGTYYYSPSGGPGDGWECGSDQDGAAYCNARYEKPSDGSVYLWQCHNGHSPD